MRLSTLIANIRNPPADSMVGYMTRADGRTMRFLPFVTLINLVWLFVWVVMGGAPFKTVILPTLISVPIFVYLHLCANFYSGPNRVRLRYVAGIFLMGYGLAFFNMSALGYLIFGFFLVAYLVTTRQSIIIIVSSIVLFLIQLWLL